MSEKPAFEVICGDHAYRVWADGHVEGFPDNRIIINRIRAHANERSMAVLQSAAGRANTETLGRA